MKKVIFFIALFLLFITDINAKEYMEYEFIDGFYSNRVIDGEIRSTEARYTTYQGEPVYCIKLGIPVSDIGYDKYYLSEIDDLTGIQKRDINLIMYYGYLYEDHNSIYYYMATQELIWDVLGNETYWTTEDNGMGNILDISEYKNEILDLYNAHFIRPSIDISNIDFEVGKEVTLIDTNNVIEKYFVMHFGDNVVTKNGNEVNIKLKTMGYDSIILETDYGLPDETIVFKEEGHQSLIQFGRIDSEMYMIEFDVHGSEMTLNRIDNKTHKNIPSGDASLEGAIYNIYDEDFNFIETLITDSDGKATIDGIYLRNYIIEEILPSKGYVPNTYPFAVTISFGNTPTNVYIEAEVISKKLTITNIYKENDAYFYDDGIVFEVYKDNNLVKSLTTNNNGICDTYLDYGTYVVKQLNSKEGYEKVEDFEIFIDYKDLEYEFITEKTISDTQADEDSDNNNEDDNTSDSDTPANDGEDSSEQSDIEENDESIEEDIEEDCDDEPVEGEDSDEVTDSNETNDIEEQNTQVPNSETLEELPQLFDNSINYSFVLCILIFICIKKHCFS